MGIDFTDGAFSVPGIDFTRVLSGTIPEAYNRDFLNISSLQSVVCTAPTHATRERSVVDRFWRATDSLEQFLRICSTGCNTPD